MNERVRKSLELAQSTGLSIPRRHGYPQGAATISSPSRPNAGFIACPALQRRHARILKPDRLHFAGRLVSQRRNIRVSRCRALSSPPKRQIYLRRPVVHLGETNHPDLHDRKHEHPALVALGEPIGVHPRGQDEVHTVVGHEHQQESDDRARDRGHRELSCVDTEGDHDTTREGLFP